MNDAEGCRMPHDFPRRANVGRLTRSGNCGGLADMNSCYYADALYGDSPFQLEADGSSPFDGNLTYINMQDSATGNLLTIPISMPDPNSPGGYQILWIWVSSV
jgi:hypothetical protein